MQLTFDPDARAMYVNLTDTIDYKVAKTVEAAPEVFVDFDKKGKVLGVEILNPGIYTFKFIKKIADRYHIPQLKRIQHPEKIGQVIPA